MSYLPSVIHGGIGSSQCLDICAHVNIMLGRCQYLNIEEGTQVIPNVVLVSHSQPFLRLSSQYSSCHTTARNLLVFLYIHVNYMLVGPSSRSHFKLSVFLTLSKCVYHYFHQSLGQISKLRFMYCWKMTALLSKVHHSDNSVRPQL